MTPAIAALKKAGITHTLHEYSHDPSNRDFGLEAAEKLEQDPATVFKTLLVSLNNDPKALAVAIVPVDRQLVLKAMAKACKAKKADMADPAIAERVTGYLVGGISPLGQKKRLPTVLDASAQSLPVIFVSGGRRGLDIALSPGALAQLLNAGFADIARA